MTIQIAIPAYGKSKAALQAILRTNPHDCKFYDPSIFPEKYYGVHFSGADIKMNDSFPVVMDPDKRTRFALVRRTASGFRVS